MKNKNPKAQKKPITQPQSKEIDREKSSTKRFHILSISLILLVSIAIYSNTLKNGFVYDDETTIVNNTLIKDFGNLSKLFTKEYFTASAEMSYRPVVTFTYFIDYAIYGIKPWGYHLTNVLLHALNGVILYIFLTFPVLKHSGTRFIQSSQSSIFNIQYSIFNFFSLPLLISLIFVTHPVLTEDVNAISFREDLLSFFFYMSALSIYLLLKAESNITLNLFQGQSSNLRVYLLYALSCFFYLIALLSKEMAVTLPLIIYLYEWIYRRKGEKKLGSILLNPYNIGYILITLFYLYLRFYLFHNPYEEVIQTLTLSERLMTIPYLLLKYLILLIAPVSLSADYVITPVQSLISLKFIIPFIIIVLLIILPLIFNLQSVFGITFFLITLIPVYNIIPIVNPFAERYLYLPTVGFVVIIGLSVQNLIGSRTTYSPLSKGTTHIFPLKKGGKGVVYFFFLSILIIYSLMVVKRNTVWNDGYSLWSDAVIKMPESSRAHNILGTVYAKQDRLNEAIKELKLALTIKPDNVEAHNNLGNVYNIQGRLDDAIKEYKLVLTLKPDNVEAHNNLGKAYESHGQLDKAVEEFKLALTLKPDYAKAHNNLGNVYDKQGWLDEAIKEYLTALRLNPDMDEVHNKLGNIYAKQGKIDEAIREYRMALTLKSDLPEAHNNLGNIYMKQGNLDEATKEYLTALKLNPDYANAYYNLGNVYHKQGRLEDATKEYLTAIRLKPDFAETYRNLGLTYIKQQKLDEAIDKFLTALKLNSDDPITHYNMALAYKIKGLKDRAIEELEIALKLKPDYLPARQVLESLRRR